MTRTEYVTSTGHRLWVVTADCMWTVGTDLDGESLILRVAIAGDAATARRHALELCQQIDAQEAVLTAALQEFTGLPFTPELQAQVQRKLRPLMLILRQLTPEEIER
jgi:hypothetical protein